MIHQGRGAPALRVRVGEVGGPPCGDQGGDEEELESERSTRSSLPRRQSLLFRKSRTGSTGRQRSGPGSDGRSSACSAPIPIRPTTRTVPAGPPRGSPVSRVPSVPRRAARSRSSTSDSVGRGTFVAFLPPKGLFCAIISPVGWRMPSGNSSLISAAGRFAQFCRHHQMCASTFFASAENW